MREFIGYHGTELAIGTEIITKGSFAHSVKDTEWLGSGIYFFEDDLIQAKNWCTKVRCYSTYCIIRVDIKVSKDKILDFSKQEAWDKFSGIKGQFRNSIMMRLPKYRTREIPDGVFINLFAEKSDIHVVRGVFITPPFERSYKKGHIAPMQIQLCVRNEDCICSLKQEA